MERLQLTGSEAAVGAAWQAREALQWVLWSFTGQNLDAWRTAGPRGWPVACGLVLGTANSSKKDGEMGILHDFATNFTWDLTFYNFLEVGIGGSHVKQNG